MNIPSQITTLLAGIALTLISLWYGQNHGLMPIAASEEANQVDGIFNLMMTIATGLFLLIQGVLIYVVIKFRRKKGDETDGLPVHGNVPLEMLWTAIPAIVVFIIAIYSFEVYNTMGGFDPIASRDPGPQKIALHEQQPPLSGEDQELIALNSTQGEIALGLGASPYQQDGAPMVVNVTGLQYAWIFNYIDSGITAGELHIPVGQEVQLKITAQDVLHAFWLPEFRLKQDAIPGRETELRFTASRVGEYPIVCAELCGAYHGAMKSTLYVQTPEEYESWVQQQQVAQLDTPDKSVATIPAERSDGEFLAPYAKQMGVEAQTLEKLSAMHDHSAHHVALGN